MINCAIIWVGQSTIHWVKFPTVPRIGETIHLGHWVLFIEDVIWDKRSEYTGEPAEPNLYCKKLMGE